MKISIFLSLFVLAGPYSAFADQLNCKFEKALTLNGSQPEDLVLIADIVSTRKLSNVIVALGDHALEHEKSSVDGHFNFTLYQVSFDLGAIKNSDQSIVLVLPSGFRFSNGWGVLAVRDGNGSARRTDGSCDVLRR